MIRFTRFLCALLLLPMFGPALHGQVPTGTPPFGSFAGGPDIVDLANLNLHLTIPVLHKSGRGTDFTYDLSYDSSVWYPITSGGSQFWQPVYNMGWRAVTEAATGYISADQLVSSQCGFFKPVGNGQQVFIVQGTVYDITNWAYHDAYGVTHRFSGSTNEYTGTCTGTNTSISPTAQDASGYQLQATAGSGTVLSKTGTNLFPPVQIGTGSASFTDRNGNQLTVDGSGHFFDTLSGTTAVLTAAGSGTPSSPTTLTYTTSTGGPATYTINYTNYTVATNFGISSIHEYKSSAAVALVTSIVLPDNSQYTFAYEATPSVPSSGACTPLSGTTACVTGRIISVMLPTGGNTAYAYAFSGCISGNNGILPDGSTSCLQRTTPDTGGVWTYAQVKDAGAASTTTITDPSSNQTVVQFQGIYETQRQAYQGAAGGTPQQTTNTCYTTAAPPCTSTAVTLPIQLRTVTATIPPGNLQSQHTDKFDVSGNLTESDDYDFATAAPFPLLRQTIISYASLGTSGMNLNAFRQTVTVKDGSGTPRSRQDTNYDQASLTCITGAAQHDDTGHGCSFTARANPTSIVTYTDPVTPGGAITKNFTYDSLGNLRTAQLNCCQNKSWSYSTATSYAYPDSVTSGSSSPQLTTSYTYDLNMGLVLTSTDPNNLKTTLTYDNMGRTLTSQTGSLPATNYTYVDSGSWSVKVCAPVQGTNTACQKSILDNQGRTVTTQVLDGSGTLYSAVDTVYDSFGRASKTSNPYTGSPASWTQVYFDALGRMYKTTLPPPDSSFSTINFADNTATLTDPAGKQRKTVVDGLGRLTSVFEPDPSNGNTLTLQTSYAYNVFDQLTQVTQGAQTRSYTYDALGRLLSTTTPEGGTTCFGSRTGSSCNTDGYDNFNNLLKRTDARGVLTSYGYDTLNRLTSVSYTTTGTTAQATPSVTFTYGTNAAQFNNGLLITMTDGPGSENYAYNALEQMTQLQKAIGATTYTMQYAYNLAGELTQITYPSGRVIQQSVDAIGRLCEVAPSTTGCGTAASPFATGYGYNVNGQVTGFKYGNGIYASLGFSTDRLQLNCLDYSTTNRSGTCAHDSTTKFGLNYSYGSAGSNNGLIAGITDSVDNGRSVTYTYDALYRLSAALTTGSTNYPQWGLSWGYDRYGNRLNQTLTAGSGYQGSVQVTASTNQINCIGSSGQSCSGGAVPTYDASGNMTNDGTNTLVYDAENKAVSATNSSASGSYTYDGNGHRVQKVSGGTTTVYVYSGSQVIAEYDGTGGIRTEHVYGGAQRVASIGLTTLADNGFESGLSPYWTGEIGPGGSFQVVTDATRAHSGNNYVQLSSPASSTGASVWYATDFPVQPGDQVTFGGWAYLESGGGGPTGWWIEIRDANHSALTHVGAGTASSANWQFQQTTYTMPANAAYVALYANLYLPTASTVLRVDDGFISAGKNYYHTDHLSTRLLTDSSGNVVAQQGHYPFGDPWYNATNDKLVFTTYERDSESGNDYAQARFYRWLLGRFLSLDPLSGSTSDPQSLDRYTYVENNPTNATDPSGQKKCWQQCPDWISVVGDGYYSDAGGFADGQVTYIDTFVGNSGYVNYDAGTRSYSTSPDWQDNSVAQFWDVFVSVFSSPIPNIPLTSNGAGGGANSQVPKPQSPGPSNPTQQTCVEKALSNIPGVTSVAQTGPAPFPFFGHINETDTLTFNSPSAMTNFLTESSRTGLIPSTVSEYGFGPGVRLPGGLHSEGGAVVNGQFTVTSHIDLFNPNGGLAPLLGHVFADVLWGHILGRNQTKLDKGC